MMSANNIPFDYVLTLFREMKDVMDDTAFCFLEERETGKERGLGCLPEGPRSFGLPYWADDCDEAGGFRCAAAEELFDAPIYDGRSLRERWPEVWLFRIGGLFANEFIGCVEGKYPLDSFR